MQATLRQRSYAMEIRKELGIELPAELTVEAYAEWIERYKPLLIRKRCDRDVKDLMVNLHKKRAIG